MVTGSVRLSARLPGGLVLGLEVGAEGEEDMLTHLWRSGKHLQKELKPGNMAKSFWNAQPTGHQLHTSLGSKMESLFSK